MCEGLVGNEINGTGQLVLELVAKLGIERDEIFGTIFGHLWEDEEAIAVEVDAMEGNVGRAGRVDENIEGIQILVLVGANAETDVHAGDGGHYEEADVLDVFMSDL